MRTIEVDDSPTNQQNSPNLYLQKRMQEKRRM